MGDFADFAGDLFGGGGGGAGVLNLGDFNLDQPGGMTLMEPAGPSAGGFSSWGSPDIIRNQQFGDVASSIGRGAYGGGANVAAAAPADSSSGMGFGDALGSIGDVA